MAELVSVLSGIVVVIRVISLAVTITQESTSYLFSLKSHEKVAISRTYGRPPGWLIITFFGNTATEYERIERVVLQGSDEDALRFRDSDVAECNMPAVAGAVIAQVAPTALSLPSLSLAHWTARAFLLFATVSGCLSVCYACSMLRNIGKCYQAKLVRDWLSTTTQPFPNAEENEKNETQASLSGLAIYQGFLWTRTLDIDAGKDNSRNVVITSILSTGFYELFFLSAGTIKAIESLIIRGRSSTKPREPIRFNDGDFVGSHRKGDEPLQLEEFNTPAAFASNDAAASAQNDDAASEQQSLKGSDTYGALAGTLEAAAKAHILSAEADRKVASEYAEMSGPQSR